MLLAAPTEPTTDDPDAVRSADQARLSGPYCGLTTCYAALRLAGDNSTSLGDLFKSDYLHSPEGSTIRELKRAVEDRGFRLTVITDMSSRSLRRIAHPLILHTRSLASIPHYDHFLLYLGEQDGKALIYDIPQPPRLLSFAEVNRVWDGIALAVETKGEPAVGVLSSDPWGYAWAAAMLAVLFGLLMCLDRLWRTRGARRSGRSARLPSAFAQCVALAVFASTVGYAYNALSEDDGLLASGLAGASLHQRDMIANMTRVGIEEVRALHRRGGVFVDARVPAAYDAGHLPGAINIPVTLDDRARRFLLRQVPKDAEIVVYCENISCPFSIEVAGRLISDGYTAVKVFREGWNGWSHSEE